MLPMGKGKALSSFFTAVSAGSASAVRGRGGQRGCRCHCQGPAVDPSAVGLSTRLLTVVSLQRLLHAHHVAWKGLLGEGCLVADKDPGSAIDIAACEDEPFSVVLVLSNHGSLFP
jgi:hypothetical protein